MTLDEWIFEKTSLFNLACCKIAKLIKYNNIKTLDELVIHARFPARTVILTIDYLLEKGKLKFNESFDSNLSSQIQDSLNANLNQISSLYLNACGQREKPVLLWSQRRLIPISAIKRAKYIMENLENKSSNIVFLGDDDLVSPLLSALLPNCNIYTIDIDKEVLEKVMATSKVLNSNVITIHQDLSKFSTSFSNYFDVVVCDPFPTGDGSFELMFWKYSNFVLKNNGLLFSTISPSHKPYNYSKSALDILNKLGFILFDLQANHDAYEVFEFEFTDYEKHILNKYNLNCSVSQTKSIFTAILTDKENSNFEENEFDFTNWTTAISRHYLTQQAGYLEQIDIAQNRGVSKIEFKTSDMVINCGFDINLLLNSNNKYDSLEQIISELKSNGVNIVEEEYNELIRFSLNKEIDKTTLLPRIGLALRALESWHRYKLE